ncbi:HET-domain-containing protein, partial [Periconia macrospinosa]
MAGYWLHTCLTSHQNCRFSDAIPQLPTRVIDVGNGIDKPVRLIASDGAHGLYCTLSYRWYDSHPFKTTTENISQLYQDLPENVLHPTIREAITTTRKLGLPYLWVDALCIIQDDAADWAREAARMSAVYENSILTIAAIDSPSADEGIYRKRTHSPRPYNRDFPPNFPTGYFGYGHPFFVFSRKCRPRPLGELDTRGWCLQEQFLSPRILSYAGGELFWECSEMMASESYPGGKDSISLWCSMVERFTRRHLTVESDRLVAIQGISDVLTAYTNEEIVMGMCKSLLPRHLLWWVNTIAGDFKVKDPLHRPTNFSCPTWSWAS